MKTISATTLNLVSSKAKEFIREDTEQSLLASVLLSISTLELVLTYMIDLDHKIALLNIGNDRLKKLNNKEYPRGYDLDKILKNMSVRSGSTLGEMIRHIEKYLIFPEKDELLDLLRTVNSSRNRIVHTTLQLYEKNSSPISYIRKLANTIATNADMAIDLAFTISDRSSKTNLSPKLLK